MTHQALSGCPRARCDTVNLANIIAAVEFVAAEAAEMSDLRQVPVLDEAVPAVGLARESDSVARVA
jgi:hypothetical protein